MPGERSETTRALSDGWSLACSEPGACADPASVARLTWREAPCGEGGGVTAAGALADHAGERDYDARDWWFRCRVDEPAPGDSEELVLAFGGLATHCEVWLDDAPVLRSESMYAAHTVIAPDGAGELWVCCRALAPWLAQRRRPRARWRTKVVGAANLRFVRTMLLGRAPGFAPGPAVVGPWRPVTVVRRRGVVCDGLSLRPRVRDGRAVLEASGTMRVVGDRRPAAGSVTVSVADASVRLELDAGGGFAGELAVGEVALWWPHTHGSPALHEATIAVGDDVVARHRVGFRALAHAADLEADGPALAINGVDVFCRGAVWTPASLHDPDPGEAVLRPLLERVRAAGLNLLRVVGTACYESEAFWELCDELGILVWQDLMFANLDYPESDPEFMAAIDAEVRGELTRIGGRAALAVVCGGSEVAQQVAMLGLDPALASGPLYGELLPRRVEQARIDAPWIPSAPWGGEPPFRPDRGVSNYYGVGAYLRPLHDARRSEVRFASECLAFANVPDGDPPGDGSVLGPDWKAGVPRDVGAGWDFDDVRDHYLRELAGVDPVGLRYADPERYLELSRLVSGEVMAETFGEWRRTASACRGAIVLWCKDLVPGAGWGLLDSRGQPKVAARVLARALAPVAVWTTDEGLAGVAVHVANDRPQALRARLRVALYRDGRLAVEEASTDVELEPHSGSEWSVEAILGRFVDVGWVYRFGPPGHDLIVASLEDRDGRLISQAFRFPTGRRLARHGGAELGMTAHVAPAGPGGARLTVAGTRFLDAVRIETPGWTPEDDAFGVEPGHAREVALRFAGAGSPPPTPEGRLRALNLAGAIAIDQDVGT